jgi:ABC-2 type transport system permease protein
MQKLLAGIRKEFLVLVRDLAGLAVLFILPVILLVVVTVAQENGIRSTRDAKAEVLLIPGSNTPLSDSIESAMKGSGLFRVIRTIRGDPVSQETAISLIRKGEYPACLVLQGNDSSMVIWLDPTLQESYKQSLAGSLTFLIKGVQARMAMQRLSATAGPGMDSVMEKKMQEIRDELPPVEKVYPVRDQSTIKPTLVQNNIPGFILFAMFFIVIPLSGSLISEKKEGPLFRLRTLPAAGMILLSSKVVVYLAVCLIQFLLMIFIGIMAFPAFFGYPPLQLGSHPAVILLATIASALAAIGFGTLIGAGSRSHSQAALTGSILVVILGVVSGTFLPLYLLPAGIRFIGNASPMRWGIDCYIELFVRDGNLAGILPEIFLLLLFFIFAVIVSIYIFARQK